MWSPQCGAWGVWLLVSEIYVKFTLKTFWNSFWLNFPKRINLSLTLFQSELKKRFKIHNLRTNSRIYMNPFLSLYQWQRDFRLHQAYQYLPSKTELFEFTREVNSKAMFSKRRYIWRPLHIEFEHAIVEKRAPDMSSWLHFEMWLTQPIFGKWRLCQ